MNLLLLRPAEVDASGRATVSDRRARHLLDVIGAMPGQRVRAGLIDGPLGSAEVIARSTDHVSLRCSFETLVPERPEDTLLLAVPRPKVLRRCLSMAASLGFGRIVLFRSWRVDKSHLLSRELEPSRLEHHLLLGLEQACRTRLPEVLVEPRFRPFVEDRLEAVVPAGNRFVADPGAATELADVELPAAGPISLVIGPERGLTGYETGRLVEAGFACVRAGSHPLVVETAIAFVHGQLGLLRSLARHRNAAGSG